MGTGSKNIISETMYLNSILTRGFCGMQQEVQNLDQMFAWHLPPTNCES